MIKSVAERVKKSDAFSDLARKSPTLLIFVFMIAGVLYTQDRNTESWMRQNEQQLSSWMEQLKHYDELNRQRVERCHSVQEDSVAAMNGMAEALNKQSLTLEKISWRLEEQRILP